MSTEDLAPGIRPLFELQPRAFDREVEVSGTLPPGLEGSWYLNGPGRFEVGGRRYRHWLDGDGAVLAIHFGGGHARAVRRFVGSRKWTEEETAGAALFRTFGTSFAGDRLLRGVALESPVNVSVHAFAGELLAFGEQGLPWSLDSQTLETRAEHTFGGALNQISPFSAHPHFDPESGEMVTFGVSFAAHEPVAQLYRFDSGGTLLARHRVPIGLPATIHDFALSPSYAVFWVSPYVLEFGRFRSGGSVQDALDWRPELGSRCVVAARDDGRVVAEVPVGDGYSLHSIGAFEPQPGRLVVDVVELDRPAYPSYELDTLLADAPLGRPVRLEIDLASQRVVDRIELPFDLAPDFPAIDPQLVGREARDLWLLGMSEAHRPARKFFDILARLSWDQPQRVDSWQAPAGSFLVGEPVFAVSADGAEVLICPMFEGTGHQVPGTGAGAGRTVVLLFAARDVAAGPVARVDLGEAVAPGFHGCWVGRGDALASG